MEKKGLTYQGYILAAGLGAIGGGLIIAVFSKAIPRMMSEIMSGMMKNMISQMGGGDCNPVDI